MTTPSNTYQVAQREPCKILNERKGFHTKKGEEMESWLKGYTDSDGKTCTLSQMVKTEPEWAANRIKEGEKAIAERDEALNHFTHAREVIASLRGELATVTRKVDQLRNLRSSDDKELRGEIADHDETAAKLRLATTQLATATADGIRQGREGMREEAAKVVEFLDNASRIGCIMTAEMITGNIRALPAEPTN